MRELDPNDEDDSILLFALNSAAQHERMTDSTRAKDAFFDGIMAKTSKLQTRSRLVKAYGAAFVCQDGNCKVCCSYRDGEPVKCRTCHGQLRPKEPSQHEVCQFHKSHACLELAGWDLDGKSPESFMSAEDYGRMQEGLKRRYRSVGEFVVGCHRPRTVHDEDWGVKKCGCLVHVHLWETCAHCSPARYKTTGYSVQWRHYVDVERIRTAAAGVPLVYNSDYYNRIFGIMVEANKDVNRVAEAVVDYADCDSLIFETACSFCDRLPMPDDPEPYKRCGRCKAVRYCSSECQRAAWPKHKQRCEEKK